MKASELIKHALTNGFYVRNIDWEGQTSDFMCHALEFCREDESMTAWTKAYIENHFDGQCSTLSSHLSRTDEKYKSYRARWGHHSKACFNLRVKWFEALILKLESKGL